MLNKMVTSSDFLRLLLDTVSDNIAVIDDKGYILYINQSWNRFGQENNLSLNEKWIGTNYLDVCEKAAINGDKFGKMAAAGIRNVIQQKKIDFYLEYPCHSPDETRWFMMRVTHFSHEGAPRFVITHTNITERKLAEERVLELSRIDSLTNLPNRRFFDDFLHSEWSRCIRQGAPLSLAIIDIDHFKLLNDTFGHQAGDECLKKVAHALSSFARRPGDFCARYGGEEFSIVFSSTTLEQSKCLIEGLNDQILGLKIPNPKSPTLPILTVSIGLASIQPNRKDKEGELIHKADELLYTAKQCGRNQISYAN